MTSIAFGSSIRQAYEIIVSKITFKIFPHIRYLPDFFGVWTLEIVPTLDKMVFKLINYNDRAVNIDSHANREAAF
jgi:hypothetical protein